jgi:hypothetical protein
MGMITIMATTMTMAIITTIKKHSDEHKSIQGSVDDALP